MRTIAHTSPRDTLLLLQQALCNCPPYRKVPTYLDWAIGLTTTPRAAATASPPDPAHPHSHSVSNACTLRNHMTTRPFSVAAATSGSHAVPQPILVSNMDRRIKPARSLSKLIRRVASFGKLDVHDKENYAPEPSPPPPPLPTTRESLQPRQPVSVPMAEEEDFSSLPLQDRFVHKV